jgi:transposase
MGSRKNVDWLRATGRRYILGTPKAELRKWAPALAEKAQWREIRDGIEVKLCAAPDGEAETFILCRSRDRVDKEKAMHERFSDRIAQALAQLQGRIAKSKKRLNRDAVNRQIGRLLQRNQRAAARFAIELKDAENPAGFVLAVSIQDDFDHWAALSEGAYLLRSNVTDWSDEKLWRAYIQLTQAEAAFRIQKDQLSIRPIWHQREDRVQAHILVCFLAFVLWKTLELWQERAGLGNSPRTLLEELARIQAHDVILPTHTHGELRLRCVTQPDAAQAALLDRLGLVLPKRIRLPDIAADPAALPAA